MRKRSDKKRQTILDAAYGLFREKGFEKTSMLEICARAGGSKATIYSYFDSKEKLFVECMFCLAENYLEGVFCEMQTSSKDVRSVLQGVGRSFLRMVCSPEMVCSRRLVIAEAGRAGIGRMFYEKLASVRQQMTAFLLCAMTNGNLRGDDADLAAGQFKALLEAELFEPLLLCADTDYPDEHVIALAAERAVATFMSAYARDESAARH